MTDIPEAILSKAREIYESSWPDPVRAIAEALMEASQQWRPIETAPKHYKPILACNPDKGHEAIVVHNGAEWELLSHDGFPMGVGFYPTHWSPLPKPPEGPVDITDIAQAAHPIIDAGNALIQHLKGKSA
jgi:hypothetical protein